MPGLKRTIAPLGTVNLRQIAASPGTLRAAQGFTGLSADQHSLLQGLDESLAGAAGQTRARLVQGIHACLSARKNGEVPSSETEVALGLRRVERALRTSPLHIGFISNRASLYEGPRALFLNGIYENAYVRGGNPDELHPDRRTRAIDSLKLGREQPLYGALNFSLRGHKGWGDSCLVLKPHLLDQATLGSRDTGDPDCWIPPVDGTPRHLLPIIEDWVNNYFFRTHWAALAGQERTPIPWDAVDAGFPVEARIFTPDGRLYPHDLAMICVDMDEFLRPEGYMVTGPPRDLKDVRDRLEALRQFEEKTGVPVVVRPPGALGQSFLQVPGYGKVIDAYAARLDGLERAASVTTSPPHYTQILMRSGPRPSPSSLSSPAL